jgi:hypothetical protein
LPQIVTGPRGRVAEPCGPQRGARVAAGFLRRGLVAFPHRPGPLSASGGGMLRMRGDCGRVGRFERVSNEFLNATLITSTRKVTRCVAQPAVERSQHPAAGCGIPPTHRSVTRNARCGSTNAPHSVRAHPTGPRSPAPQPALVTIWGAIRFWRRFYIGSLQIS